MPGAASLLGATPSISITPPNLRWVADHISIGYASTSSCSWWIKLLGHRCILKKSRHPQPDAIATSLAVSAAKGRTNSQGRLLNRDTPDRELPMGVHA